MAQKWYLIIEIFPMRTGHNFPAKKFAIEGRPLTSLRGSGFAINYAERKIIILQLPSKNDTHILPLKKLQLYEKFF